MSDTTLNDDQALVFRRGPGGRPTKAEAERRHRLLLETASRLFLASGFDTVSLEAIAEEAGVAKRFVYARYRDKGELFFDAMRRQIEQRVAFMQTYQPGDEPAARGLFVFAQMLEERATYPVALAVYRTVITQLHRFPALGQLFAQRVIEHVMSGIVRVLTIYRSRGEIDFEDAMMAAELFMTLTVLGARNRALIGHRQSPQERSQRTAAAIAVFLQGYGAPRASASAD